MKKIFVLSLTLMLLGCTPVQDNAVSNQSSRFVRIESTYSFSVYCDRYTKVMYVYGSGGVFTVLVDSNGLPLLYEE